MKNLIKFFFVIPIIYIFVMFVIELFVAIMLNFPRDSIIINILFQIFSIFLGLIIYILIYKTILIKCDFSFKLFTSVRTELKEWKRIKGEINESKFLLFFVIFCLICLSFISSILSFYLQGKLGTNIIFSFRIGVIALFAPVFEEFIFRKLFFYYCEINKIKHTVILNIVFFSFIHIIPSLSIIILGIILAYIYIKFNSLILNIFIHFGFNLLGIFLPILLNYIR